MPRRKGRLNTPQKIIDDIVRKHHEVESIKLPKGSEDKSAFTAQNFRPMRRRLLLGEYIHFYNNQRIRLSHNLGLSRRL